MERIHPSPRPNLTTITKHRSLTKSHQRTKFLMDESSSKMQTKSTMPDIDGKVVALINKSTDNGTKSSANVTSEAKGSIYQANSQIPHFMAIFSQ